MIKSKLPIRLCVYQPMKSKDISKAQSSLINEIIQYGQVLDRVVLVHLHKHYSRTKLNDKVELITIPHIEPTTPLRFALSIFVSYLYSIPILLRLIYKYKINLIRADDVVTSGFPCVLVSKILGLKSVVSLLGDVEDVIKYKIGIESKYLRLVIPIVRQIEKFVISNSDGCLAVTKHLEDVARNFRAKRVYSIFPNMDLSIFGPRTNGQKRNGGISVLFVGRLEPEKGPLNVIKVAEILRNVEFVIVGYGSLESQIKQLIKNNEMTNVKLLGLVEHDKLPKLYQNADIFLLPSYSEGLPVVMIEAMTSELPVIVSKVGAVAEILANNNGGFAVSPGNIEEIVSKIQILEDFNYRAELGRKARMNVLDRFGKYIETQVKIYENIISN